MLVPLLVSVLLPGALEYIDPDKAQCYDGGNSWGGIRLGCKGPKWVLQGAYIGV